MSRSDSNTSSKLPCRQWEPSKNAFSDALNLAPLIHTEEPAETLMPRLHGVPGKEPAAELALSMVDGKPPRAFLPSHPTVHNFVICKKPMLPSRMALRYGAGAPGYIATGDMVYGCVEGCGVRDQAEQRHAAIDATKGLPRVDCVQGY